MDKNWKYCFRKVVNAEGGWSDHPKDPGGATMRGVTLTTFRRYLKPNASKADLRAITMDQVETIYKRGFWDPIRGSDLPSGLDLAMFDFSINSGPGRPVTFLQRILKVPADGRIGPVTLDAIAKADTRHLIRQLCADRLAWMRTLKTWRTFGKGWKRRVEELVPMSIELVDDRRPVEPRPGAKVQSPPATPKPSPAVKSGGFWARLFVALFGRKGS